MAVDTGLSPIPICRASETADFSHFRVRVRAILRVAAARESFCKRCNKKDPLENTCGSLAAAMIVSRSASAGYRLLSRDEILRDAVF
jgi:hypothetical protein